jgi:hypothetical protein
MWSGLGLYEMYAKPVVTMYDAAKQRNIDKSEAMHSFKFASLFMDESTRNETIQKVIFNDHCAPYLHLLSNIGMGLPADLWVPATKEVAPVLAYQGSIGFYHELSKTITISTEAYYKTMNNLIQYKNGSDFSFDNTSNWEDAKHLAN